jgi:hypothetical protein
MLDKSGYHLIFMLSSACSVLTDTAPLLLNRPLHTFHLAMDPSETADPAQLYFFA